MADVENKNFADQDYWDNNYRDFKFFPIPDENPVRKWMNDNLENNGGSVFEVGCFPGGYLELFGRKNYVLNGIDLTPEVTNGLPKWLKSLGYKTGNFYRENFLTFKAKEKYDVVCSFGFIEHFSDYRKVVKKQASLVKVGGILVIETPNFRGFVQRYLHWSLDRENYKRHNIDSMRLDEWVKTIRPLGFEIVWEGYIGGFDFWNEDTPKNERQKRRLEKIYINLPKRREQLKHPSALYSPYMGLIARKVGENKVDK